METIKERLLKYSVPEPNTGCWLWMGPTRGPVSHPYGNMTINRKNNYTHRLSYENFIGKIPAGFVVMHKCDTTLCINPDHLMVGTQKQNMADCKKKNRNRAWIQQKTCKRGHALDEKNNVVYFYNGVETRYCRTCRSNKIKEWRLKHDRSSK